MDGTESPVRLFLDEDEIELAGYGERATIGDLIAALERMRLRPGLATVGCAGCGLCCRDRVPVLGADLPRLEQAVGLSRERLLSDHLELPARPDPEERSAQIADLARQFRASHSEATLLYEWNTGEPIVPRQGDDGFCHWLQDRRCSVYPGRPLICSFYLCNFGDRLSALFDAIVRQGVWHSYVAVGWIESGVVAHNPFVSAGDPGRASLAAFDIDVAPLLQRMADTW